MTSALPDSDSFVGPFDRLAAAVAAHPGTVLDTDPTRGITFVWHDASPLPIDASARERGYETALLTAFTPSGECVGYLRLDYSTPQINAALFPRLLAWAEENHGWMVGYGDGQAPTPADLWKRAHNHANTVPASLAARGEYVMGHSLTDAHVPTDPAVIEADLAVIERRVLAPAYQRWLASHIEPTPAYAHVADDRRGTGLGRAMYLAAAAHLGTQGRVLCASTSQTAPATALWARLLADPTVPTGIHTMPRRTGDPLTVPTLDYRSDPTAPTGQVPTRGARALGWAALRQPRKPRPAPALAAR